MANESIHCPECASENVVFSNKHRRNVCEDCGYEFTAVKPVAPLRISLSYVVIAGQFCAYDKPAYGILRFSHSSLPTCFLNAAHSC